MLETEKKKKKKRILPITKRGNVLPILLLLVILIGLWRGGSRQDSKQYQSGVVSDGRTTTS